ncbi:MAG TPA: CPBP family intramembrane glutamic endopeptidase [Actinomycetes bacterium]
MTVPLQARAAPRAPAVLAALAGLAFLLARPGLEALPAGARTGVLAGGYLATGLAAALAAGQAGGQAASPRRRAVVLALGIAAVAAAALLARPVPPLPGGTVALGLGLLAAVAEEALFRGALYALLERRGALLAVGVSASMFALVHVPSYGLAALPVDLGAGLLFGWQRWASGRWTVPAATHAAANLLAVILR